MIGNKHCFCFVSVTLIIQRVACLCKGGFLSRRLDRYPGISELY